MSSLFYFLRRTLCDFSTIATSLHLMASSHYDFDLWGRGHSARLAVLDVRRFGIGNLRTGNSADCAFLTMSL